ncbi:MAG: TauD/TfdA family dioxygenase [Gammaproteobacteria bacterium]|nr:TauD/TfdA family dioxygenase [Gammaproteobacteria bacterium]
MSAQLKESTLRIRKIKPDVAAEVTGIDLREPVDETTRQALYDALLDNVALVIRDQKFTPAQYQAAAGLFGELMEDQNRRYLVDGFPLISTLSNRHKDSKGNQAKTGANATWHTDHTNQECPPKFTCLYGVEVPDSGGGTSVCNTRAAYEALPQTLRKRIDPMQTANTLLSSARVSIANPDIVQDQQQAGIPPMIHPLVRTHPERGTRAIWFHKGKTENIIGMSPEASQEFLDELLEQTLKPEFIYVHPWRAGDMLIIDNRSALHKAGHDFDHSQHRLLYRALVRGDRPF